MQFFSFYSLAFVALLAQLGAAKIVLDAECLVKADQVDAFKAAVSKQFRVVEANEPNSLSHTLDGFYQLPTGAADDPTQIAIQQANISAADPLLFILHEVWTSLDDFVTSLNGPLKMSWQTYFNETQPTLSQPRFTKIYTILDESP